MGGWLDKVQLALDIAGFIPGVGAIADVANAAISVARGDYLGAALSLAAAVPGIGDIAAAGKLGAKAAKMAKGAKAALQVLPKVFKGGKIAVGAKALFVATGTIFGAKTAIEYVKDGDYVGAALSVTATSLGVASFAKGIKANSKKNALSKGENVRKNAAAGAEFEAKVKKKLKKTQTNTVGQITVKTKDGTKARPDFFSYDETGRVVITEAKASPTAPLTDNQKEVFEALKRGEPVVVVGKGKGSFKGGTIIENPKIEIMRGNEHGKIIKEIVKP